MMVREELGGANASVGDTSVLIGMEDQSGVLMTSLGMSRWA